MTVVYNKTVYRYFNSLVLKLNWIFKQKNNSDSPEHG